MWMGGSGKELVVGKMNFSVMALRPGEGPPAPQEGLE